MATRRTNNINAIQFKLIIAYLLLIVILILLGSCNPSKQALKLYDKAKNKDIITVANAIRTDFPCITQKDTLRIDSIIVNERIDSISVPCVNENDTVWKRVPCKCKENTVYQTKILKVRDSVEIFLVKNEAEKVKKEAQKQIDKLNKENRKLEAGRNTWRVVAIVFIGIVAGSVLLIIKKLKLL